MNLPDAETQQGPARSIDRSLPPGSPSPPAPTYEGSSTAPDAADRSGWFESITYPIASWFGNTERDITKNAGFVSDGFEKSVTGLKTDLINIGDYIKPIIWGLAAIIALLLLNKWT